MALHWKRVPNRHYCQSYLVVQTRHATLSTVLEPGVCGVVTSVRALATIDTIPGAEVVVTLGAGSVAVASVYTVRNRQLVRMTIEGSGRDPFFRNTFAYYGGVAHDAAVDCVRPGSGRVVLSFWALSRPKLIFHEYMRVVGTRFLMVRTTQEPSPGGHYDRYGPFRRPQPFPSCAVARGPDRY